MPRKRQCCVGNCHNLRQDAILYIIPKNEIRLNTWLKCLGRVCEVDSLVPGVSSVCGKHFETRFVTPKNRLLANAFPSLFTSDEISTGTPSLEFTQERPVHEEHNYSGERHYDHNYTKDPEVELRHNAVLMKEQISGAPSTSKLHMKVSTDVQTEENPVQEDHNNNYSRKRHYDHSLNKDREVQQKHDAELMKEQISGAPSTSKLHMKVSTDVQTEENPVQEDHNNNYSRKRHYDHSLNKDREVQQKHDTESLKASPEKSGGQPMLKLHTKVSSNIQTDTAELTNLKLSSSRKRLIAKHSALTPLCQRIYKEYKRAKKQLSFHKRTKDAMKFCRQTSLEKLTTNMNPLARRFLNMQVNLCTKKKNARRYTVEEKVICLSIMKQSPKCYRFLSKIFILPSKSTLNEMIANLIIEPGINPQVFNLLKKEVNSWDPKKKTCSIIFDEMSLDAALTYDKHKDSINGYVQLQNKTNEIADHALVFMLRGAVYKWQQPLCFYFCKGATSGIVLKNILKEIVTAVTNIGLNPIALVCDQGAAFQSAINSIKQDTSRKQILEDQNPDGTLTIAGVNLHVIYDPSHLIKGLRNNFLTKNIKIDGKISKWQDIVDVYETDCNHTETRMLHKLNDQCVVPDKIKKMKVKNCVKVLSNTVAAALNYTANFGTYIDGRPVSNTLRNTAETVLFMDKLFDSVNGTTTMNQISKGKPLRQAVREGSTHHDFWVEAIKKLEKLKFIDNKGMEKSVPSVKNFITTLKSYMRLWQLFKEKKMYCLRPRYFNSDPIENFFGQVRAYNYRNNDPNCHNFSCTFKSLLITRLIKFHSDSFNCEDDSANQIINLNNIFEKNDAELSHPATQSVLEEARRERLNVHSRAYTAGWVVGKILRNVSCNECQKSLTSTVSGGIHDWIGHREYTASVKKRLKYPSEGAVRCFSTVIKETNCYLETKGHENNLSKKIKDHILENHSFDFLDCAEHKERILNDFLTVTIKFSIMNWCNVINKILKGTDVIRLSKRRSLPPMQQKAFNKYKKKLKNKSFNKYFIVFFIKYGKRN